MALAVTNLTSGSASGATASTASISPSAGEVIYLTVASAVQGGETPGGAESWTISGCGLTWSLISKSVYGSRRGAALYRGSGGTPSSGTISLQWNDDGSGTPQEYIWVVDKVTGADDTTPNDSAATPVTTVGGTSITMGSLGTPDAGDYAYASFVHTGASSAMTLNSELETKTAEVGGGAEVRRVLAAYDTSPDGSPTPGVTWSGAEDGVGFGVIINAAAGGGSPITDGPALVSVRSNIRFN